MKTDCTHLNSFACNLPTFSVGTDQQRFVWGSGCGPVGRVVASNTKGPRLNQDSHRKTCVDFLKLAKPNVNKFHVDYLDYNKIDGGLKHFDWFKR